MGPIYCILVVVMCSSTCTAFKYFLSNASGEVEKENFMYYSMSYDGTILLELTSVSGDCDLYVSQNKKKPTYEPDSNCLQSITCGIDSVIIPKSFKRPVGIGVFGHPSHEVCAYNLILYRIHDSKDLFNFDPYAESFEAEIYKKLIEQDVDPGPSERGEDSKSSEQGEDSKSTEQEEESFFWVFLRSVVVFLIETIL